MCIRPLYPVRACSTSCTAGLNDDIRTTLDVKMLGTNGSQQAMTIPRAGATVSVRLAGRARPGTDMRLRVSSGAMRLGRMDFVAKGEGDKERPR